MNDITFPGLFFPAVAGLFFFLKKPYSDDMYVNESKTVGVEDRRTGVSRYIEKQIPLVDSEQAQSSHVVISGVAKYIKDQEKNKLSSVERYTLRIRLAERQAGLTVQKVTGVGKYIKNLPTLPKTSGVSRYLKKEENQPKASSVSKYITRMKYADKANATQTAAFCETTVTRYLKQQEYLPKLSSVSKYLVKKTLLKKMAGDKPASPTITGVARYLQKVEILPKKVA